MPYSSERTQPHTYVFNILKKIWVPLTPFSTRDRRWAMQMGLRCRASFRISFTVNKSLRDVTAIYPFSPHYKLIHWPSERTEPHLRNQYPEKDWVPLTPLSSREEELYKWAWCVEQAFVYRSPWTTHWKMWPSFIRFSYIQVNFPQRAAFRQPLL